MSQRLHQTGLFAMSEMRMSDELEEKAKRRTRDFLVVIKSGPNCSTKVPETFASYLPRGGRKCRSYRQVESQGGPASNFRLFLYRHNGLFRWRLMRLKSKVAALKSHRNSIRVMP